MPQLVKMTNVKLALVFEVQEHFRDDMYEIALEVGCAEDIEMYMKHYANEDWASMFEDNHDISHAQLTTVRLTASDDNGNRMQMSMHNQVYASFTLNPDSLELGASQKLEAIKKIIVG